MVRTVKKKPLKKSSNKRLVKKKGKKIFGFGLIGFFVGVFITLFLVWAVFGLIGSLGKEMERVGSIGELASLGVNVRSGDLGGLGDFCEVDEKCAGDLVCGDKNECCIRDGFPTYVGTACCSKKVISVGSKFVCVKE